ncbi:MAG: methionyl-tRNA formyltransferase [Candidatus Omnitrophota bacterium]
MKIVFFGSSHFAVPALEALINSRHEIICVVTQPDKQKGRHLHVSGTEVKNIASRAGLKIFQSEDIKSKESVKFLKNSEADVFVIVSYGQILSQEILDIPKIMPLNIHASLLPRYRGAAPINWAIINADKKTGVTIMYVTARMDCGPVLIQKEIKISEDDTFLSLEDKVSKFGAELLIQALISIENKDYRLIDQDEEAVVYAPKLKKEMGLIDWSAQAVNIASQIKGVLPWPGAFTLYRKKILKIFKAEVIQVFSSHKTAPGEVLRIDKDAIVVACGKGFLKIKELQLESGKRMSAGSFIIGHNLSAGVVLGQAG